jgi:hypothetical protein
MMVNETLLVIEVPSIFYSRLDEDHFFGWLQSIPDVQQVRGIGNTLELVVRRPMEKHGLGDLIAVMTRYNLDRRPLKPLCDEHPDDDFRRREKYWHAAVYG